jgi:hypothetical protein
LVEEIAIAYVKLAKSAALADTVHPCNYLTMAGLTSPLTSNFPRKTATSPL